MSPKYRRSGVGKGSRLISKTSQRNAKDQLTVLKTLGNNVLQRRTGTPDKCSERGKDNIQASCVMNDLLKDLQNSLNTCRCLNVLPAGNSGKTPQETINFCLGCVTSWYLLRINYLLHFTRCCTARLSHPDFDWATIDRLMALRGLLKWRAVAADGDNSPAHAVWTTGCVLTGSYPFRKSGVHWNLRHPRRPYISGHDTCQSVLLQCADPIRASFLSKKITFKLRQSPRERIRDFMSPDTGQRFLVVRQIIILKPTREACQLCQLAVCRLWSFCEQKKQTTCHPQANKTKLPLQHCNERARMLCGSYLDLLSFLSTSFLARMQSGSCYKIALCNSKNSFRRTGLSLFPGYRSCAAVFHGEAMNKIVTRFLKRTMCMNYDHTGEVSLSRW